MASIPMETDFEIYASITCILWQQRLSLLMHAKFKTQPITST